MTTILLFIGLIIFTKLVEDNLPNMHYEKIIDFFAPVILLAYIGVLSIVVKITNNPKQKKTLLGLLTLVAVCIIVTKAIEQHKKQASS
jgi:uncharacterized membrane protein